MYMCTCARYFSKDITCICIPVLGIFQKIVHVYICISVLRIFQKIVHVPVYVCTWARYFSESICEPRDFWATLWTWPRHWDNSRYCWRNSISETFLFPSVSSVSSGACNKSQVYRVTINLCNDCLRKLLKVKFWWERSIKHASAGISAKHLHYLHSNIFVMHS